MPSATVVFVLLAISCLALPACTEVAEHRQEKAARLPQIQAINQLTGGSVPLLPRAEHAVAHAHRWRALRGHTAEDAPAIRTLPLEENHAEARHSAKNAATAASTLGTVAGIAATHGLAGVRAPAQHSAADSGEQTLTAAQAHELLNATSSAMPPLMQPLPADGKAAVERHRACAAFYTRPVRSVALVGNGPLTETQRLKIEVSDLVIRFNKLNNRFCGERLDVWLLRRAEEATLQWHGLGELAHCSTAEALEQNPLLWLYGGSSWWFNPYSVVAAAVRFPQIARRLAWQGLPFAPWKNLYQTYVTPLGSPSTGWIGLMLALDCKPRDAELHLYGFNWSRRHWRSHAIAAEERFVRMLADRRRLTVHETACKGLRFCGPCNVVARGEAVSDDLVAKAGGDVTNITVACSPAQATSKGELSTKELLFREPEVDAPPPPPPRLVPQELKDRKVSNRARSEE